MNSIYRELADKAVDPSGSLRRFEVMPRGCPFFDDWKAILIEEGESETLIWRARRLGAVESATWPLGTFRDVVLSAIDFFARDGGARSLSR